MQMLSLISALYHVLPCFMIIGIGFISFIYLIIANSICLISCIMNMLDIDYLVDSLIEAAI